MADIPERAPSCYGTFWYGINSPDVVSGACDRCELKERCITQEAEWMGADPIAVAASVSHGVHGGWKNLTREERVLLLHKNGAPLTKVAEITDLHRFAVMNILKNRQRDPFKNEVDDPAEVEWRRIREERRKNAQWGGKRGDDE